GKRTEELQRENLARREEVERVSMFDEIVGTSPPLRAVLANISRVAPTDSTVLLTGETGTGKELVARAIHKRSSRSSRAFVSVNCAAIPSALIASELFRHEKGASSSALPVATPPLPEPTAHLRVLVPYVVERYATKAGKAIRHVDKRTLDLVQSYRWPGNVRERQNVIERAVIMCETDTLVVDENWL